MNDYFSLDDPQNNVPTFLTEGDPTIFKKIQDENELTNIYISQNASLCGFFGSYPSEKALRKTDLDFQSSNIEYSTASNFPQSQRLKNQLYDESQDKSNKKRYSDAKKPENASNKCDFPNCGKTFSYLSELKRHSNIHSKDQNFICSNCQKSFARKDNLKAHERVHFEEKPYECNYPNCNEKFKNPTSLKHHFSKHSIQGFKCNFLKCMKNFQTEKDLNKHLICYHQSDPFIIEGFAEKQQKKKKKIEKNENSQNTVEKFKFENSNEFLDSLFADSKTSKKIEKSFEIFFDELQMKNKKNSTYSN